MSALEEIARRADGYLAPISAEAPAGVSAKFDPRYEKMTSEIAKLDAPTGGAVEWPVVVEQGSELLRTASKDLLVGAHLACGLHSTQGLDGLATGVAVLGGMVERYWETLFPELKRLRGRVNALSWFIDRIGPALSSHPVSANDRAALELLGVGAARLAEVVREKFGNDAPAMRPLTDGIERLKLSLPAEAPPPPPPAAAPPPSAAPVAVAPVVSAAPAQAAPVAVASAPPPVIHATAPALAAGGDSATFLREFGGSLASASAELRRADPSQAAAYRTLRTGLWLHLAVAPPRNNGKTSIPAPPAPLRDKLERMAQNGKWVELLEEAESALQQHRLWLDLHRISAQSLASLGPSHAAARQAIVQELGAFLRRVPGIVELTFADGSPSADAATRTWLDAEVLVAAKPGGSASGAGGAADDDGESAALDEARKLVTEGNLPDAIAKLQARVASAPSAHARFRARLALARTLMDASQPEVARAHFVALDEELRQHGLEAWDPSLAARYVAAHLACVKSLVKAGRASGQEVAVLYDRLSRLDPVQALKGGA